MEPGPCAGALRTQAGTALLRCFSSPSGPRMAVFTLRLWGAPKDWVLDSREERGSFGSRTR